MEAVGVERTLLDPFINQRAVFSEMGLWYAPLGTIMQWAPIDFPIEGIGETNIELNNSKFEVMMKPRERSGTSLQQRRFALSTSHCIGSSNR